MTTNPPSLGAPRGNSSGFQEAETATGGGEGALWNQQRLAEDGGLGGGGYSGLNEHECW